VNGNDYVVASSSPGGELGECNEEHCITCGDVAVTLTVVRVDDQRGLALCEADDGRRETVEIALVAPVSPADRLLVHAGTAIACEETIR
jgi:hydrogenase maturation factor